MLIILFSSKVYAAKLTWTLDLDEYLAESSNVVDNGTHGIDIVYIGGVEFSHTNQSSLYGVDVSGTEVSAIYTQLAAGIQAIHDSAADTDIRTYSYHSSNGHLSTRKLRRPPDPESHNDDRLIVVVKYGARQVGTAITQFLSEVISATVQQWIGIIIDSDNCGTKYMEKGEIIPMGKNWTHAAGYILATCATHGNKCHNSISNSLLEFGMQWANNAIGNHPYQDSWKVGFSHGGTWHLCIRVANKSYYLTYAKARKQVNSMRCPKGFHDGGSFNRLQHDEL